MESRHRQDRAARARHIGDGRCAHSGRENDLNGPTGCCSVRSDDSRAPALFSQKTSPDGRPTTTHIDRPCLIVGAHLPDNTHSMHPQRTMKTTPKSLAELRERFGGNNETAFYDPGFAKAAQAVFSESGTRRAPYAGIPTLLGAPHQSIDWAAPNLRGLDVALLGVPMDLGVTNRPGAWRRAVSFVALRIWVFAQLRRP